jgi:hypothetical protein
LKLKNNLYFFLFFTLVGAEARWPLAPQDTVHPLGNNWGEFQRYSGFPYFHPGIDVMGDTVPVYSVSYGYVKAWSTFGGSDYYWRIAVGDSSGANACDGWLYAHIDPYKYHVNEGDTVHPGDLIGYLIDWPVRGFTHCHFSRIRNSGTTWEPDWLYVENPLNLISPNFDSKPPVFENALNEEIFAFCRNNTSIYLNSDSLYGDVDIIAKIYDKFGPTLLDSVWERLIPYKIEYSIYGKGGSIPTTSSFVFGHFLDWADENKVWTVYKDDDSCDTQGDYDSRDYYFIVTNTDGDSIIEVSDTSGCWATYSFPNGKYWVEVTAYDQYGNATSQNMLVKVKNPGRGYIRLIYPNGGEELTANSLDTIRWFATDEIEIDSFSIFLSLNRGLTYSDTIGSGITNDSLYVWKIPDTLCTECMIKVVLYYGENTREDESDDVFSIKKVGIEEKNLIPKKFVIFQNYPNPFVRETSIKYGVPKTGIVNITIYNLIGQKVVTLMNKKREPGYYIIRWDGRNEYNKKVKSGIYFYRFQSCDSIGTRKMYLLSY